MTGRLPALTSREVIKALKQFGFEEHHQTGSHVILRSRLRRRKTVVPMHRGALKRSTLFAIIKQAGIRIEELIEVL
jgi:mRNA interferase HicA